MRVAIIDDTRLARQELKFLLEKYSDIEIIGEAENAEKAQELLKRESPDLIFLDIQMPGRNGFELLESLDDVPQVIFVTAYDEFAIKAFEFNALDYLQKPVSQDRLNLALDKVRKTLSTENEQPKKILAENSQVFVKDNDQCWFVTLKEISLFEILDNYTRIYFKGQKPMIPKTLNYMESRLDPQVFFRANRQQIINLKWIDRVEPWFSGSLRIYLKDGTEVDVSRRQTARFKELMSF